ncbi:MAG: acetyl-CoA carboxylase biotin carboxylase subunit [bacterium]
MLRRVLIANRGEIALRILRACHEMGIEAIAAYTQVDKDLLHLQFADDTVCVDRSSYLCPENMVMAATTMNCDAIHPGYGLLSEDVEFAEMVVKNGLVFVGAKPEHLRALGDKSKARQVMASNGLQAIPGSSNSVLNLQEAVESARDIGYPLVIKATFGGGGRGIRLIHNESELVGVYSEARSEANVNFGRDELYLEKYLADARHIEVQVLGDGRGTVVHLGTRDCSIQRRHQKIIEEAPAPGIDSKSLDALANSAASALTRLDYQNAATLEFLYQDGEFYFMEINTRLQVEHPVTEMVAGVDIVQAQLSIADSGELPLTQEDVKIEGYSIECRINAEDANFNPSPGLVVRYDAPGGHGVRVDSHVYAGYLVPHHYDSLLAKLVVHGKNRNEAIARMRRALSEFRIEGIATGIPLLQEILASTDFLNGTYNTQTAAGIVS